MKKLWQKITELFNSVINFIFHKRQISYVCDKCGAYAQKKYFEKWLCDKCNDL